MPHRLSTSLAAILLLAMGSAVAMAASRPALVAVGNLVVRADGDYSPRTLPKRQFVPIEFRGRLEIAAKDGGRPSAMRQAVIDFDRDGRLRTGGLPTCAPESVASASPEQARQTCASAIVGTGRVDASISLASGPTTASSPLTLFNGPPQGGNPTVVVHAQTTVPETQTFAIVVPVERRAGAFRYRATFDVPPIAAGLGAITHIDVEVGRRFTAGGRRYSYASARCSTGLLRTHGRLTFEDGTIIDGAVEKPCRAKPG